VTSKTNQLNIDNSPMPISSQFWYSVTVRPANSENRSGVRGLGEMSELLFRARSGTQWDPTSYIYFWRSAKLESEMGLENLLNNQYLSHALPYFVEIRHTSARWVRGAGTTDVTGSIEWQCVTNYFVTFSSWNLV